MNDQINTNHSFHSLFTYSEHEIDCLKYQP
ncbi:Uncharacterised protein [Legionella beliardensis]|uniref:Uncharacterized protein n=1 Tax=Legionella beliardensis TaxID=91822 RepID=A0A378I1F3_9GAMM|nr:Uncharacterised protein [Legionella beliardensis]